MSSSANIQKTVDLFLEKHTYGGDTMGRLSDGRAVFVPFGLPGEHVRIRLTDEKRGFARGELLEILEASPHRIVPRCKHFGICGGCHYQSLPYEEQLNAKREILRDQLSRIGRIENPPVQKMIASPDPWNYRNHVQFHLTEAGKLGFVGAGLSSGQGVISITECHLPEASLNSLWPQLEFEPDTDIERVSLRAGKEEDLMLVLEGNSPESPELEIEAGISVAHVFEENAVVIAGNDHIFISVLGHDFRVSAASFFQVNTAMAEKMVHHLMTHLLIPSVPTGHPPTLLDIYCGVGLFSAFFAPKCERVIGIESSPSACEDFTFNLDEFDNIELYEGSAEEVLPALVGRIALSGRSAANPLYTLVDPPRAGLDKRVVDGILNLNPQVIAYVSCDPSTLARDAARLIGGGYQLKDVTPFDLFPQTYHIESISLFER
ncbi:MAG TPA: class I SAM-dependent RNA methyltransferase [Anaerolineales bacterium]|nr:class I SAM-dependent RNA methyltransferase [Anaerolineales bacterium]HLO32607.1 class I SAM-dependent RNA methyltransferase [Anaerolineales bacterium]